MADEANTTPVESGNPDNTPVAAEPNATTTPPEAEQTGNTREPAVDVETIVKKRLDRERRKWEAEREEAEKRARMDEAERLKAELADRDKAIEEARAAAQAAERRAALTGKVADPTAALRLLEDDHLDADGNVNVDALLKSYPFLAPQAAGPTPTRGAGGSTKKPITADDLKGMSPEEINSRWDEIQASLGKKR